MDGLAVALSHLLLVTVVSKLGNDLLSSGAQRNLKEKRNNKLMYQIQFAGVQSMWPFNFHPTD